METKKVLKNFEVKTTQVENRRKVFISTVLAENEQDAKEKLEKGYGDCCSNHENVLLGIDETVTIQELK